ncbi:DNA-binding response regulator [Aliarcobacter trophiarum LMG 25534]|uniref:DNA-binding response regulator n=2 Tax=Aliarcobacter trophiarum TaxID=708186 RepID=A0AAD0VMP3_9BACT|nr:response regulator transcription factor [Aliarcobacter trophiarum]AXK49125.1 signal transduction response regulator [Aliarcobacter trophiarum LMG 25534]RXI26448.1 DNA-binding response regulator [Aliarcobacter trophiarum]RXJ89327.1 DNA-binding response regulator [Aliarcobacter trophiarum LMG 25534]
MEKNMKSIRKISNTKIIIVSDDEIFNEQELKEFYSDFKEVKIISTRDTINYKSISFNDVVVVDMDIAKESFTKIAAKANSLLALTPKIVVSSISDEEYISKAVNIQAYTFLLKPFNPMNLKLAIIMCINQTKRTDKVELGNGVYFDEYRDQFFKKGGVMIDFTRLEKGFLKLLIEKRDEITSYDTIKDVVWKGKEMSIYTMRNIVNKIRQKTYYEIVRNHSSRGYTIDLLKK